MLNFINEHISKYISKYINKYINKLIYYIIKFQLYFIFKLNKLLHTYTNIKYYKNQNYKKNRGNILNGILLCILYIPILLYNKSILLFLTIIISILYHFIYPTNKKIQKLDILINTMNISIIIFIAIYNKCIISIILFILGIINYCYFYKSKLYIENKMSGILAHSFLVQYYVGFGGLILNINKLIIP
tara:strand:+ start:41 stop:604 length:564 start_codon:yes stop_codon:yes gene_type:complete